MSRPKKVLAALLVALAAPISLLNYAAPAARKIQTTAAAAEANPETKSLFSGEIAVKQDGIYTYAHYYEHPETKRRVVLVGMQHGGDKAFYERAAQLLDGLDAVVYEGSGEKKAPNPEAEEAMIKALSEEMAGTDLDKAYFAAMRLFFARCLKSLGLTDEWEFFDYKKAGWVSADKEFWSRVEKDEKLQQRVEGLKNKLSLLPEERKKAILEYMKGVLGHMDSGEFTPKEYGEATVFLWADPRFNEIMKEAALANVRDDVALEVFDRVVADKNPRSIGMKYGAAHISNQRRLLESRGYVFQHSVELRNFSFNRP